MSSNSSKEQAFLKRLTQIIETNFANEKFGVSELAREMGMSRSNIHRRLKAINNQSLSNFIRTIRLEKARDLLFHNDYSASEVAYKVGFNSPAYFNHCYHKYFGYPPGETKKQNSSVPISDDKPKFQPHSKNKQGIVRKRKPVFVLTGITLILLVSYLVYDVFQLDFIGRKEIDPVEKSLIVLPFKNLSPDKNNQYFVDGISEDILNHLTKISDLTVVAKTSAEQFRESSLSSIEIARKASVNYILKGSIRRHDENVRISVQLIDAKNDRYLWSENYDRQMADVFVIQSDIAKNVADELRAMLSPEELNQIEKQHTVNTEAYDYYLMGRFFWNTRTQASLQKSSEYFEKAMEADPDYALAYAGLADAYYARTFRGWIPREAGYEKAYKMAERALEMDENLPEAYAVMGIVSYYGYWEWEKARTQFEKALEIDSNCIVALLYYSNLLDILGESDKARKHIGHAVRVEPFFSLLHIMSGHYYAADKKYKESVSAYQRCMEINPDYRTLYFNIFRNYMKMGDEELALKYLQMYFDFVPEYQKYCNELMNIYKSEGIEGLIKLLIKVYLEEEEQYLSRLANLYAELGQKDEVLYYLEKIFQEGLRGVPRVFIRNSNYQFLYSEPRFLAYIDSMGLMPYFKK